MVKSFVFDSLCMEPTWYVHGKTSEVNKIVKRY